MVENQTKKIESEKTRVYAQKLNAVPEFYLGTNLIDECHGPAMRLRKIYIASVRLKSNGPTESL
jgi:hypothetical protein